VGEFLGNEAPGPISGVIIVAGFAHAGHVSDVAQYASIELVGEGLRVIPGHREGTRSPGKVKGEQLHDRGQGASFVGG